MGSDIKIAIEAFTHFRYPDAVVICEKIEYYGNRKDVIVNPLLIVEVLSSGTESIDRGVKFDDYKTLSSFKEYVLVSQQSPMFPRISEKKKICGAPKWWRIWSLQ